MTELAVVIATLNRPDAVLEALADVAAQAPPSSEIAVVDQSDPQARRAVEEGIAALGDRRIRYLYRAERGLPGARNAGISATKAPIVWFVDDDVRLRDGCVAGHLDCYRDPTVGGVVGQIHERVVRPNVRGTANRIDWGGRIRTNLTGARPQAIQLLKGANMSFRRRALEQAGPFDPQYLGTAFLEDADMSIRVARCGWTLRYAPSAALDHLSLPAGGVRVADALQTESWRFHNTAYFVRRHRGMVGAPPLWATFAAIAARRALAWRRPEALPVLMGALRAGWRRGGP